MSLLRIAADRWRDGRRGKSTEARLKTRMLLDVRKLDELGFLYAPVNDGICWTGHTCSGSAPPIATRRLEE